MRINAPDIFVTANINYAASFLINFLFLNLSWYILNIHQKKAHSTA